jgi:hypothetical protein
MWLLNDFFTIVSHSKILPFTSKGDLNLFFRHDDVVKCNEGVVSLLRYELETWIKILNTDSINQGLFSTYKRFKNSDISKNRKKMVDFHKLRVLNGKQEELKVFEKVVLWLFVPFGIL